MPRDLDADLKMLDTVLRLAQQRDIASAAAIAERELASGYEHPLLLNVLATRHEESGRLEDALRLLERAVELSPENVAARHALALCLQRMERPREALIQIDELLRQQPNLAFGHVNKGNALIAIGALAQARICHLRALELDPHNVGGMAALASIATHRGEHGDARNWANRTLARVPGYPDAVLSLAAAELADGDAAAAEPMLRALIADTRAGETDKARAQGLLGDVLDFEGRHAEAFVAYGLCNAALERVHRRFAQSGVLPYANTLARALVDVQVGWTQRPVGLPKPGGARRHVFLMGFPRSGTTLLEVVLDGHPDVVSLEEHELLTEGVLRYLREPVDLVALQDATDAELEPLREVYWRQVAGAGVDVEGRVFIDKHPLNSLKLPLIARLFPDAQILFAYRDPRDVVLSCFRRRFKMNPAMYQMLTLDGAARFYAAVMSFADTARPILGLAWRDVRYEAVMADFDGEIRSLCEYLGLTWSQSMGSFAHRVQSREHSTPSTAQLARGLDRSGVGQWRSYAMRLAPVQPMLQPWIDRLGASW